MVERTLWQAQLNMPRPAWAGCARNPHAPIYPYAASLLVQIGELQAAAGTRSEWESYVRDLRERYSNRPALRRELDKARLPS